MNIKIKSVEFLTVKEDRFVENGMLGHMVSFDKEEIAKVEFSLTKDNIKLNGNIEMSKNDYLVYVSHLEDRIKELLLN